MYVCTCTCMCIAHNVHVVHKSTEARSQPCLHAFQAREETHLWPFQLLYAQ